MMKIFLKTASVCCLCFLYSCSGSLDKNHSFNGWGIRVDSGREVISLSNETLDTVLDDIRLQIMHEGEPAALTGLTLEKAENGVVIHTELPVATSWTFTFEPGKVVVGTLAENASLTALAPASINRFPARIANPGNILESLTAGRSDYTGVTQVEKYYVPEENPHVMYLSLGEIEATNLHSLFDKQTNTAILFAPSTKLTRIPDAQSLLKVSVEAGPEKELITLIPEYFTDVLGMPKYVPYDDTYHKTAPTGWNHWLAFFRQVTEKDIVDHADFISENLLQYGMEHCQLDDGYDHVSRRLWVENWDPVKFPNGPEYLAQYIKGKGLIPGLWTVPYCYSVNDANPDWFIRDDEGKILMDYQGGGELDFTREDVIQEYWIPIWKEFKRQGWEYHKFDMGNTAYMWHTYQHNFYDTTMTAYDASVRTMQIWRDIMGPEVWYTNHPDVEGGRMGFLDVAGLGRDPGVGWERMNNMFEVISNNAYQNHIIWFSDPDCMVIRGKPSRADSAHREFGRVKYLTLEEARTCASLLSLSGMQYLSGDDLLTLEEERMDLIKKTIPTLPIYPIDVFGRGRDRSNYPDIVDLKVNRHSRTYDVVAATNWTNEPVTRTLSFAKELGLEAGQQYLVFDFWQEQLTGVFESDFQFEIPPHGTRVFLIHKQTGQPLLLATNRHISGTFSISDYTADMDGLTLKGASATVPGVPYSLFCYLPGNMSVSQMEVDAPDAVQRLQSNGLLEVSFTGREEEVAWNLKFENKN